MGGIPFLSLIIIVPLMGMVFSLIAKDDESHRNSFSVTFFVILFNILLIIKCFTMLDTNNSGLQLVEAFNWMSSPDIDIIFGVDLVSLVLILAIHIAILIGMAGVRHSINIQKPTMAWTCLFLAMINGFFVAADIFSSYMFFEAMLLPLFMLIGMFGEIKKKANIFRYLIYNLFGAMFLFAAVIIIHSSVDNNVLLKDVGEIINRQHKFEGFVWTAVFIAFISRIPIWPFHYWISATNSIIKNPLVFIISNIVPITAIYGFMRFVPVNVPYYVSYYIMALEIIAIISVIFIALIGIASKEIAYKIFSYMTVYYIIYLMSALTKDESMVINIAFSAFAFLITSAAMTVVLYFIDKESDDNGIQMGGILCSTPRTYFVLSILTLAAIGMPVSSFFLNNFIIVSNIFGRNIWFGSIIVVSMLLAAGVFLQELYRMKDASKLTEGGACIMDMSKKMLGFMMIIIVILFVSFINPLWFAEV